MKNITRMKRIFTSFYILLCFISVNAIAEIDSGGQVDFSSIEEQERRQIISELTYHLDIKQTCDQTLSWDDSGSGGDLDGYFFIPKAGQSEYIIGGHASQKRRSKYHCVSTVSEPTTNPKGTPPLLVAPVDWKMIWKDKGSGATKDGSMWQAIPPDNNYRCLGNISQLGHEQKPNLPNYRCVHSSLTEKVVTTAIVWSDKGTGADKKVTMFRLPNTDSFTTVPARASKIETYDLKKDASGVPGPEIVDTILSERMKEIKADIEAQLKAKLEQKEKEEQKRMAKEEEEKKRLAKEAEEKRLAEEKEKKRLAKEAEEKRLAEEKERNKHVKEAEQKSFAEEVKQKTLAKGPNKKEDAVTGNDNNITDGNNNSKSLNDLIIFFIVVFFGLIIVSIIVYKFTIGSKKMPTK